MKRVLSLLEKKRPDLALLLSQNVKAKSKSKITFTKPKECQPADILYVYGFCDLREHLTKYQKIIFIEDDLDALASFLQKPFAKALLESPKVEIFFQEMSFSVIQKHFSTQVEFIAASYKDEKKSAHLEHELCNKSFLMSAIHDELSSLPRLCVQAKENLKKLTSSCLLHDLKNSFSNLPAIIVGAGPSLDQEMEEIKKWKNNALIIAGGSAISALSSKGILPDLAVAIDPNPEEFSLLKQGKHFELPLIYSLRVFPHITSAFHGPMSYLSTKPSSDLISWIEEELSIEDKSPPFELPVESLSVTSSALYIASYLGCSPIILVGVDLGGEKPYAEGIVTKEGGKSDLFWEMERSALSKIASRSQKKVFNASHGRDIPHIPKKELTTFAKREYPFTEELHLQLQRASVSLNKVQEFEKELEEQLDEIKLKLKMVVEASSSSERAVAEIELEADSLFQKLFGEKRIFFEGNDQDFWKSCYEALSEFWSMPK